MEFEIACQSNSGRLFNGGLTLASDSCITHNEMVEGWNATMTEANRQQSTKTARTESNAEVTSDNRSSMSPVENGTARVTRGETEPLDDQGTSQEEAAEILQILRDEAFESSDGKLALALGRTTDEVKRWFSGDEPIDADVLLKARALAMERGIETLLHDQQDA
jgi:hypothetical protein